MKKRNSRVLVCFIMLVIAITLTACADETVPLQERIDELEAENAELQSTISSLRTDLDRAQSNFLSTQHELQILLSALEADDDDDPSSPGNQNRALAVTYAGEPNQDMSWPLSYGNLPLGLQVNLNELDEDVDIVWHSTNENVFTVISSEDGISATVTPSAVGSAQVVVTVGDRETRSWVRIT